jgi:hypothetical protein
MAKTKRERTGEGLLVVSVTQRHINLVNTTVRINHQHEEEKAGRPTREVVV